MTKILFCSDEHVLLRRKGVPVDFELDRYKQLFSKLLLLSKDHDIVIHGGDMFDRTPTIQEVALVVEYLNAQETMTFIIDGNHEAIKKGQSFLTDLAKLVTNHFVSIVTEVKAITFKDFTLGFLPYQHLKSFKGTELPNVDILVTHVRGEIPPHVKPEIDLTVLDSFPMVLAGDLHSNSNSQRNIVYPGSPLTTSFYRNKPVKGVISVCAVTKTYKFIDLKLPALLRVTTDVPGDKIVNGDFIDYEVLLPEVIVGEDIDEDSTPSFTKHLSRVEALALLLPDYIREEAIDLYVKITSR